MDSRQWLSCNPKEQWSVNRLLLCEEAKGLMPFRSVGRTNSITPASTAAGTMN